MKKVLIIFMALIMVLSNFAIGFAIPVAEESKTSDDYLNLVKYAGVEVANVERTSNSIAYDTEYEINGQIIKGSASITEEKDEIVIISEEPGKRDVLVFKDNGDVILNGYPVVSETVLEVGNTDDTEFLSSFGEGVGTYEQRYNKWQDTCPYGSSTQYSVHYNTVGKNITFEQTVSNQTVHAFIYVIMNEMFPLDMSSPTEEQLQTWIEDDIENYIRTLVQYNPGTYAVSMKILRYVHVEGRYITSLDENIFKVHMEFYTEEDFGGICRGTSAVYNRIKS